MNLAFLGFAKSTGPVLPRKRVELGKKWIALLFDKAKVTNNVYCDWNWSTAKVTSKVRYVF